LKLVLTVFTIILSLNAADAAFSSRRDIKYKTFFGKCPSRVAGSLVLKLTKLFEETHSLKELKLKIVQEKLKEKHFLSDYQIEFDPGSSTLSYKFECPDPLMKVVIYKENGVDTYEALLAENGDLLDPTLEVILRSEQKLSGTLPYLALPIGNFDKKDQLKIAKLFSKAPEGIRSKLSEVILDDSGEMTLIMALGDSPTSIFLGDNDWDLKIEKLKKVVDYMETKKKFPSIINLLNAQKVVVKFNN